MTKIGSNYNPEPTPTTLALGEEGNDRIPGDDIKPSSKAFGEEGNDITPSTLSLAEQGNDIKPSSKAFGEEGNDIIPSTEAIGEEGDDPACLLNVQYINGQYNRLLELVRRNLERLLNNTRNGIGIPPIICTSPRDYWQ